MNIEKYIDIAYDASKDLENRDKKHISLVLNKKGDILVVGKNYKKTHPIQLKYAYPYDYLHSETDALRIMNKQKIQLGNLKLLNFRFSKTGVMGMSRPCSICIKWCQEIFEEIWYFCPDKKLYVQY